MYIYIATPAKQHRPTPYYKHLTFKGSILVP